MLQNLKGFRRSKLVVSLTAIVMVVLAMFIPLSGTITYAYAQTPTSTSSNFVVNANQDLPGLDTGIDLTVGTGITFTASGQAAFGTGDPTSCDTTEQTIPDGHRITTDGTLCDPKFDPAVVLPSAPVGELLAQIGSSGWFAVGSSDGLTVATSGRLFLLYNDISGEYGNNSGSYQVTVTVAPPPPSALWGVDSYDHITQSFYNSVNATFGAPDFWARYIGNNPGYPNDMDLSEAPFAHSQGFAILPIYFNYAPDAVNGYATGQAYATEAIKDAQRRLKISKGVAIFNDIEESSGVNPDAPFIQGWYDRFNSTFTYTYNKKKYTYQAGYYKAGYYGNGTSTSRFATAYCSAVNAETQIGTNSFIWSSEPSGNRTSKTNAPPYGPNTPSCANQTQAWQYAILGSGGPPNVDTDEALPNLPLWHP